MFPVKRKLLRSCIALTPVVRSNEQQLISVQVDVDTLTFDRHASRMACSAITMYTIMFVPESGTAQEV